MPRTLLVLGLFVGSALSTTCALRVPGGETAAAKAEDTRLWGRRPKGCLACHLPALPRARKHFRGRKMLSL